MEDLTISFIQTELFFEDITANLSMFEEKIWQLDQKVDLIVLPEMFNSGFSMNVKLIAEPVNGKTMKWMKQIAAQTNAVVTGSLAIKEGENVFNRLIWMYPDGKYLSYDKIHTFTYSGESDYYQKGKQRLLVEYKGWRICPLICFDLRFPETARNGFDFENKEQIDLLIYVANWPSSRDYAWQNLLKTRAIENSCYVLGVNRLGTDGNNLEYIGSSQICNPVSTIVEAKSKNAICTYSLNYKWLQIYREKFPFLRDR